MSTPGDQGDEIHRHQDDLNELLMQNIADRPSQSFLSRLSSAHEEVLATFTSLRNQILAELPLMYSGFKDYIVNKVNWSEPFVQWLVVFHASILILLVLFRNNLVLQNTVFFVSVLVVYHAEWLNSWLSGHWHIFAKEDYFDQGGAFVSLMMSLPLLMYMLVVLVNYSVMFMQTLVVMQRERMNGLSRTSRKSEDGRSSRSKHKTQTARSRAQKKKTK
jgi:hypothetical protein